MTSSNCNDKKNTHGTRGEPACAPRRPSPTSNLPPSPEVGNQIQSGDLYSTRFSSLAGPRPGNNHKWVRGAPGHMQTREETEQHGRPEPDQERGISRIRPQVVRRQARSQWDSHQNNGRTDPKRPRDSCDRDSMKPPLVTTGAQHNSNLSLPGRITRAPDTRTSPESRGRMPPGSKPRQAS